MTLNTPDKPLDTVKRSTEDSGQKTIADQVTDDTAVATIPAFTLPESSLLSECSKQALANYRRIFLDYSETLTKELADIPAENHAQWRAQQAQTFYRQPFYQMLLKRYPVTIEHHTIGGVLCEVFCPDLPQGSAVDDRVLINFHGGGFIGGSRTNSHLESVPLAALMQSKVISVDYRLAPEHCFPAAGEDAEAVYRAVLADYRPERIGLFGTSAGAELCAILLARLRQHNLPGPAAVGLIACGAFYWRRGDYAHIGPALVKALRGAELGHIDSHPYFKNGITADNPDAFPGLDPNNLAAFPPALLISSTRDMALSAVVYTHRQLVNQGVAAELHVWDGLEHAFHYNPWLPETDEAHRLLTAFFERHIPAAQNEG